MNSVNTTETFIPYNQLKDYMIVDFISLKQDNKTGFNDIMVVEYKNKDYLLHWNEHYSYYSGKVAGEKGYIP